MWSRISIKNKILATFVGIFIVGFFLNFLMVSADTRTKAIDEKIKLAEELTASLEKVRNGMGKIFSSDMYDMEKLLADKEKLFSAVPVVQSLIVGANLAEQADYSFKAPSFNPRNPDNEPTKFEADMLKEIENKKLPVNWKINKATNELHFMRSIKLDETCMGCHGVLSESLTGTTKDPLGYEMEGWRPGDIHGAFEFILPLDGMDAAVRAQAFKSAGLITLIVIIGVLVLLYLINFLFSKPINKMVGMVKDIAQGEGDMTVRLSVDSQDELGDLAKWFNTFVEKLQGVIKQVKVSTEQIGNATTQLSTTSEELASGAEEQQSQLSDVATSIEEMSAMILEASRNAGDTQENASQANEAAGMGQNTVQDTITGIEEIASIVQDTSDQIKSLESRSNEIGEVIQVIDDIADQTNLLALNANIEAARAGDAGRGFAVVADEVRKLAERTVKATAEIGDMIKLIQGDVGSTVGAMSKIQDQSKKGQELAGQAGTALEEISGSIANVSNAVTQIASSAQEQSSGVGEISKNVENVSTVSRQAASAAQELAASSEELSREVQGLNDLMNQFKV